MSVCWRTTRSINQVQVVEDRRAHSHERRDEGKVDRAERIYGGDQLILTRGNEEIVLT